jgi:hypothetical protein
VNWFVIGVVYHLAHYLLLRLLLRLLATGARDADAIRLAHPETDRERDSSAFASAFRACSSSKLCNLLTACACRLGPRAGLTAALI